MAKIAFNYFAYFNYKNITLKRNFDGIRKFIMTGEEDYHFSINNEPILADEDRLNRRLGHIIVINKNEYGNILAHVSLYNELKYTIFLGESDGIKKLNVGFGHLFDPQSKKIIPIEKSRLIIPKIKLMLPRKKIILLNDKR